MGETWWVRTRRATGADGERLPGPWHAERLQGGMTWCGRHPGRLVSAERRAESMLEPEGPGSRRCAACKGALRRGRPIPYRRGR